MYNDGYFDEKIALAYDENHKSDDPTSINQMIDCLDSLAGQSDILEFAIGTGRVALPLIAKGRNVKGIELSNPMVAQLRKKETTDPMEIIIGDMTSAKVDDQFSLVFLVFNTIDNLTSQDQQVACFQNAADHLTTGGRFLIETLIPPIQDLPFGETKRAFACTDTHVGIDVFDVTTQNYASHHIRPRADRCDHLSIPFRYVWPSELDLMAKLAGMKLENRWGDWDKSTFDRFSRKHISVWQKE